MPPKAKKCARKTEDGGGEVPITLDTVTLQLGQGEKDTENTTYRETDLQTWATIKHPEK